MMDLTQKILTLDRECDTKLKNVNSAAREAEIEVETLAASIREEKQLLLEEQKKAKMALLAREMDEAHKIAIAALQKKMKTFNKEVTVDRVVEHLLSVARDRVCH